MNTTKKFEYKIEFFDREREKQEILNILKTEPRLITFIYGPINSGKTALIMHLIDELPKNYVVFYVNLRETIIASYKDFIENLFDVDFEEEKTKTKIKEFIPDVIEGIKVLSGIPIPTEIFKKIFKEEKPKSAFKYILKIIYEVRKKGKTPVFIIDELQKIGDVKVNSYLIYDVFNFFIHLTKELHISHVFAISSDSLFIERVYNEAMLQGRCNYLLVDDFDEQTTKKFLEKYNIDEEGQKIVWNYFGGKPSYLLYTLLSKRSNKNIMEIINEKTNEKVMYLRNMLDELLYISPEVKIGDKESIVNREKLIELLKKFMEHEKIEDKKISRAEKIYLINKNILFLDIKRGIIKPQSRLDLLAIREILKEINATDSII